MIPINTARALKLIGTHRAIADVRLIEHSENGIVEARMDVLTELPSGWRPAGESPSGVRARETVTLIFPANYPLRAPSMTLRHDFNRSHPHIQPGSKDLPPQPCIVTGSPSELLQSRGIEGLVDQMVDWLDKAAMLNLNNPKNGWEPVRRDNIDDFMVVDGQRMRELASAEGGCIAVRTTYHYVEDGVQRLYAVDHRSCAPIQLEGVKFDRGKLSDKVWQGRALGLIVWAPDAAPRRPFVADAYLPETVTTIRDLRERATRYGCLSQLDAKLNHIALGVRGKAFQPMPLTVTFLARRPYDVIGTGSPIELCAYLVDLTSSDDLVQEDRGMVRLVALRERLTLPILRRASGVDESSVRIPWTLIGCGSVGSKIGIHMARQGHGPTLVVDRGVMSPHNFARHASLPTDGDERPLHRTKAATLADDLATLKQRPDMDVADILDLAASQDGRQKLAPEGTALLLNTTASTVVRESLSFSTWELRPPLAEVHLLGAGQVAYAAFEGPGSNPSASDLAAESYRLIAADKELRDIVFGAAAEAIVIGHGCSAVTFPMSDSRLSALTGSLGEVFARRHLGAKSETGEVLIGKIGSDGLTQTWIREEVAPWTILSDRAGSDMTIRISPRVDEKISAEIAAKPGSETGGVIIGRFSNIGNGFQVVDVIPAPPDSTFAPEKFVLGTVGLKAAICDVVGNSGGSLYAIGTWHNHLVASGPSSLDARTAAALALRQFFPVLMLIALPHGYTCLIAEAFDAHLLEAERPMDVEREREGRIHDAGQ